MTKTMEKKSGFKIRPLCIYDATVEMYIIIFRKSSWLIQPQFHQLIIINFV